jgi:NTE family protein
MSPLIPHFSSDHAEPPRKLAFVLGGGGARGAMQVGALRALLEAGIQPDMLVGTSIGAVNAAMIAIYGFSETGLERLERAWLDAMEADLLPGDYLRLMVRTMLNRMGKEIYHDQMRDFYIRNGITPDIRFRDISHPRLYCMATDLNRYDPFIFGIDPEQRVLEAVLASSAIPPWIPPLRMGEEWLMDGGALSNLPTEPAMRLGATEIIAMDLFDPRPPDLEAKGFTSFLDKLLTSVEHRQIDMELALAEARGTPVYHWRFRYRDMIPVWDFSHTEDLFQTGYDQGVKFLRTMQATRQAYSSGRWEALFAWLRHFHL